MPTCSWHRGWEPLASGSRIADNIHVSKTTEQLEARLKRVETELAELKARLDGKPARPWYQEIVGSFKDDKAFAEIIRLGRLIRQGKLKVCGTR